MRAGERTAATDWENLVSDLEKLAVGAEHVSCREHLESISPRTIPRERAARLAELAWRVHFPLYSLKALHRFVHPENSLEPSPTDREKVIYASALLSLGAVREAAVILKPIDGEKEPEALFYGAMGYFYDWNYAPSIPLFKSYVRSELTPPYRRLVGKVNLAAALVTVCDWNAAEPLLHEISAECETGNFQLLLGNAYELRAQIEIFQGRYHAALPLLERSRELLQHQGGLYSMFVEKWFAICRCFISNHPDDVRHLRSLRSQAVSLRHWDTARECDLFEALVTRNESLVRKVIMGTPSEHYRHRVRKLFGTSLKPLGRYHWLLADDSNPSVPLLEFDPYKKPPHGRALYETPQLLAVYDALTRDFYKPANIGALFQCVYPGEVFNPFSSPDRVLQLLKRLDRWFVDNAVQVRVAFKKSEFSLISLEPIRLVVQRGKTLSAGEGKLADLKQHFQDRSFSTAAVATVLGISKASAQRLLAESAAKGRLQKTGQGRSVAYRFTARKQPKERSG